MDTFVCVEKAGHSPRLALWTAAETGTGVGRRSSPATLEGVRAMVLAVFFRTESKVVRNAGELAQPCHIQDPSTSLVCARQFWGRAVRQASHDSNGVVRRLSFFLPLRNILRADRKAPFERQEPFKRTSC